MTLWRTAFTPRRIVIIAGTVLYVSGFYVSYVLRGNSEFVFYLGQFFIFILLACIFLRYVPAFPDYLLGLLSLVGLLHVLGGGIVVDGVRLYDLRLVEIYESARFPELFILKYDQFVHAFGFGVAALGFRWLLGHYGSTLSQGACNTIAVFAAAGVGALNEVSEFLAVLLFARTGVGGYFNIALDLLLNFVGAIIALAFIEVFTQLKRKRKWSSIGQ